MRRLKKFIFKIINLFLIIIILLYKYNVPNSQSKYIKKDIYLIEKYKLLCDKEILLNKKMFKRVGIPKISIIAAVNNRDKYILRFLRSIQNQNFEEIEIIFVDDYSNDNSIQFIQKYQKEDERIILIRNNKNKGTLISRNIGALISKGKYLIFPDPDDILSNDILYYCYNISINENLDVVRFNLYDGNKNIYKSINLINNQIIYQPKLSTEIFYAKGYLKQTDYSISNKFIVRTIYIKTLNSINNYYLTKNMVVYEDGLINFMLYKTANSLYHSKKVGYYYIQNNGSITINFQKHIERHIYNCYIYLKFIFENTSNNKYEKDIAFCIYRNVNKEISNLLHYQNLTQKFSFYLKINNLYLNSEFISSEDNKTINYINSLIKNAESKNNINI